MRGNGRVSVGGPRARPEYVDLAGLKPLAVTMNTPFNVRVGGDEGVLF
jgi:hypothetical protein